jgi:hypothetical protein
LHFIDGQGAYVLAMIFSTSKDGENESSPTPSIVVSEMSWHEWINFFTETLAQTGI